MKDVQTLPRADPDFCYNLMVTKICTRLKDIRRFQSESQDRNWRNVLSDKVQGTVEEQLIAIECESGNVEVQWNSIKKCLLDISDLVGKAWRKAREL